MLVGIVGWRVVGSVLIQRMLQEGDLISLKLDSSRHQMREIKSQKKLNSKVVSISRCL